MSQNNEYRIFLKGENKTRDVESYQHRGAKCDVTFKGGKTFPYNSENVRVEESVLKQQKAKDCFDFLKEIASQVGIEIESEDADVCNILSHSYSKVGFIEEESLLGNFLRGKDVSLGLGGEALTEQAIYPFGFNSSQKKAVDNALSSRISVIEGPPGTGKTQTILNIISNLVMSGQSVAVISNNNSATKNVFDKLKKNEMDFIAASLGSKSNKKNFIESQENLPEMLEWELKHKEVEKLKSTLVRMQGVLEKRLVQKVEMSKLTQELSELEIESKHFGKYVTDISAGKFTEIKSSPEALEAWLLCEAKGELSWVKEYFKYLYELLRRRGSKRLFVFKQLKEFSREYLIEVFQKQFYDFRVSELKGLIERLQAKLSNYDFDGKMKEYTELSLKLFKANLAQRYSGVKRKKYEQGDFSKRAVEFLEDYPVILSTAYSLQSSLSPGVMYDYVIVDESSQVNVCTGALALSCAKNVVVVGDLKQLSHVVNSKDAKATDEIFGDYDLSENFRYKSNSLLSSIMGVFPEVPRTLLCEHYRCSPKIIEFCNKKFYEDQLVIMTNEKSDLEPMTVYRAVEGNHQRGRMNQRQIDMINEEIIPQEGLNTSDQSLGIITPYRDQTNQLQKSFEGTGVQADTVDKFQGREKEVVVLSTVDNQITKFTDNDNRLNVAISRAIDRLILVVNSSARLENTNIGDLVRYIEYNNLTVVESKVRSVFDYLYRSYDERRKELLSSRKRVSKFDSENLMYPLVDDLLKEKEFKQLGVAIHVPLRMIIKGRDP